MESPGGRRMAVPDRVPSRLRVGRRSQRPAVSKYVYAAKARVYRQAIPRCLKDGRYSREMCRLISCFNLIILNGNRYRTLFRLHKTLEKG